ncbi:MAG: GNAT family N-acetyltransferase, partial [Phycisphaerae bacterium]
FYPTTYLGAESTGRLVGAVMGTHDHRKGWINRVAVHPDWQRRGVGRLLVEACEEALQAAGMEIISALIEQGNERSRRLFERCGYVDDVPVHYYRKRRRTDI